MLFIFQCQCGFGVQTRSVTCLDSYGKFSDKCGEEKPPTGRQSNDLCLYNLEKSVGNNPWATGVEEADAYFENEESKSTHSDNLTHLAEFLGKQNLLFRN